MKTYKLCIYLLPLMLVTAQATQQNFNNTNEKSTYIDGDQKEFEKWLQNVQFKDLQQPLKDLYKNGIARPTAHIQKTPPVYFVVGTTGAGKSTFIFTLQGNTVTKKKRQKLLSWSSDSDNSNNERTESEIIKSEPGINNTGQLILKKNVDLDTPTVARSFYTTTKGVKIYYTGKKITQPMAFCDTEGFLGKREHTISNAEKMVGSYAPYFVLKSNYIGALLFLVDVSDVASARGKNFLPCVEFLKNYFDVGIAKNAQDLKKSIMLVINNKQNADENDALDDLAFLIQASYKDYYGGLSEKKSLNKISSLVKDVKTNQKSQEEPIGLLKPFLSLFLKKNVQEHTITNVNFFELLDREKICFFYPYKQKNVTKIRQALTKLTPLNPTYLSLHDHPTSQCLIQKIMNRAYELDCIAYESVLSSFLAKQFQLQIQKNERDDDVANLTLVLSEEQKKLNIRNQKLSKDTELVLVYEGRHIKPISSSRIGGYSKYLKEVKNYGWFHRKFCANDSDRKDYENDGYLHKTFNYIGGEPLYCIVIKEKNGGNITWYSPKQDTIREDFEQQLGSDDSESTQFSSKKITGILHDRWRIDHRTAYEKNADFQVRFYSRKCDLHSTKLKIQHNEKKVKAVDEIVKRIKIFTDQCNEKLISLCDVHKQKAIKSAEELAKYKDEIDIIVCCSNYMFKQNGYNQQLIEKYLQNYNKVLCPKYTNSDTNKKHSKYEVSGLLEQKKDDGDNNNHNNASSLSSALLLGTSLLASSFSKKKN